MHVLEGLVDSTFKATLDFVQTHCANALTHNTRTFNSESERNTIVTGLQEITSLTNILSALLDKELKRDTHDKSAKESKQFRSGLCSVCFNCVIHPLFVLN